MQRRCRLVDVIDAESLKRIDERVDYRGRRWRNAAFAIALDAERPAMRVRRAEVTLR